MAETIIKTSKLCCKSGYKFLLRDIDWEIKKGEHWIVFGMNGSGKTTLLSIIAGFKKYTHGDLEVFGEHYTNDNIMAIRKKIGWVSSSFFDKYLRKESALNIVLSGKFGTLGIDFDISDQDVKQAKALLTELHLGHKINYPFDLMSKGERQNVLIARALMSNPEILVLDEPGTGLDVFAREHMLSTVRDLAEKTDVTIIYVTHYTEEILSDVFDKCLLLRNGRIYAKGSLKELFTSEKISSFLRYPVNIQRDEKDYIRLYMEVTSRIEELLNPSKAGDV